jgi:hypothetical protein
MMFLAMIAKRNGKVLKGGIPDKVMAARGVLRDWNSGKIPFYTRPPTEEEYRAQSAIILDNDAKIVTGFGEHFDVTKMDSEIMNSLEDKDEMDFIQMQPESEERTNSDKANQAVVNYLTKEGGSDSDSGSDEDMEMDEDEAPSDPKVASTRSNNNMVAEAEDYDFGGV